MGIFSFLGSCCKAVWSGVKTVVSSAYEGVKSAVSWMADKAENFIGGIKRVWDSVKDIVKPILKVIFWPVLNKIEKLLEKALDFLQMIDLPLAKKLAKAVKWALDKVKDVKKWFLTDKELEEAEERKITFEEAQLKVKSEEEKKSIQLPELINDFIIVQSKIQKIFDNNKVQGFQHYLRLRATQKLLKITEKALENAKEIREVGKGELFLLEIGKELINDNPVIDDTSMEMLNGMILKRYGKNLIPFVFEEMIASWSLTVKSIEKDLDVMNTSLSKKTIEQRNLENKLKYSPETFTEIEKELLNNLRFSVSKLQEESNILTSNFIAKTNYVDAAEGFLQILEENEQLNNKPYIVNEGERVGKVIIDCAVNNKKWIELTEEERDLIIDFANCFRSARHEREKVIEVKVA